MGNIEVDLVGDLWALVGFGGLGEEEEECREHQQCGDCNPLDAGHFGLE